MMMYRYLLYGALLLVNGSFSKQAVYTGPVTGDDVSSGHRYGDIVLAGLFPIHQNENGRCGQILDLGIQRQEAMVFAIKRINNDHTLLPNLTLGFDIRDTCVNQDTALQHSLDFLNVDVGGSGRQGKGISGVIGAASSQVSIYVANLLRLFEIPQISYASTARILSDKSRYEYFFRTVPPDSLQARAIADLIYHHNWTYVSLVHTADAYGSEGILALKDELNKHNNVSNTTFCIAADIELSLEATTWEYDEAVSKLVDYQYTNNATVIVIFGQLVTAEGVLDAFQKKRNSNPKLQDKCITWIASDAWGDQIDQKYHNIAHGMISIIPKKKPYPEFNDYFLSLNPENNAHNPWFGEYWEKHFNCSLKKHSSTLASCITEKQKLGRNYKQNSKVPFTIDAVYAFAYAIQKLTKKCLEPLCREIIDSTSTMHGNLLLAALHETHFTSKTENSVELEFNKNGDIESEGYGIFNLQFRKGTNYTYIKVGDWQATKGLQLNSDTNIEWNHNDTLPLSICSEDCGYGKHPVPIEDQSKCCWKCKDCREEEVSNGTRCVKCEIGFTPNKQRNKCVGIPPTYLKWNTAWAIITIILCFIGLVTTSSIAVLFFIKRDSVIVRRSSKGLSAVLLAGLLLCYIIPLFKISRPSIIICGIQQFTLGIGFNICYSAILIKTNLLFRIFESKQGKNVSMISTKSQLLLTMLLILIQLAISGIWLVIVPPSTKYTYSENTVELTCTESSSYRNLIVALAYNGILLITSTIYALRGRNIPDNYNEAKYINGTLIVTCIVWIVYIPTTVATVPQGAIYQTGSHILAIIFSATVILGALFFPKVYQIFFTKDLDNPNVMITDKHRLSMTYSMIQLRSNESLRSGSSAGGYSTYSAYYYTTDKRSLGDTASKSNTGTISVSARRSSVTSIKSYTNNLPSVPETVESEPSSSSSASAINMNMSVDKSSKGKLGDEDTSPNHKIEVEMVETNIGENSIITYKNGRKDDNSEIPGKIDSTERIKQKLSSSKADSMPNIIEKSIVITNNSHKRRKSKSCNELNLDIKLNSNSTKSDDHIDIIEPTQISHKHRMSRSCDELDGNTDFNSNSIYNTDVTHNSRKRRMSKSCDELSLDIDPNSNSINKTESYYKSHKCRMSKSFDELSIGIEHSTKIDDHTNTTETTCKSYKRRMSKSCDELNVNVEPKSQTKSKSWGSLLSIITNTATRFRHGLSTISSSSINRVDNQNDRTTETYMYD